MYGSIVSVLLMGMVPVWEAGVKQQSFPADLAIAPPAYVAVGKAHLLTLEQTMTASGVLVLDLETGQTLFARNAESPMPMASLTKLMTALVIVENHALDERITVPAAVRQTVGNVAYLTAGDRLTVGDMLSALLIPSGNDAAETLAIFHSGSEKAFAEEMNRRAQSLGMTSTVYRNASGLDEPGQVASARDLAWLAAFALRYPAIEERMSEKATAIRSGSGRLISLVHTHRLLQPDAATSSGAFVRAGKTGTTDEAGQCLLSLVAAHGRRYMVVIMGSRDRYADMNRVLTALNR